MSKTFAELAAEKVKAATTMEKRETTTTIAAAASGDDKVPTEREIAEQTYTSPAMLEIIERKKHGAN